MQQSGKQLACPGSCSWWLPRRYTSLLDWHTVRPDPPGSCRGTTMEGWCACGATPMRRVPVSCAGCAQQQRRIVQQHSTGSTGVRSMHAPVVVQLCQLPNKPRHPGSTSSQPHQQLQLLMLQFSAQIKQAGRDLTLTVSPARASLIWSV